MTRSNTSDSYDPTVSGFSRMAAIRDDGVTIAIVAEDPDQHDIFKAIKDIDSIYLNPWGRLPDVQSPETRRFLWQRRTPENIWPVVWCRINVGARDVLFEIQLSRYEFCTAHVPVDSWTRRTCDSEAVRAAVQRDYLNQLRGVRHYTIVKQGMKSLPLLKPMFVLSFDDERRQPRARQSRPPFSSPSSSHVPQYREVYGHHHHHARRSYETFEPSSPSQTLGGEWPQYRHGYSRHHHYQTSQRSPQSGHSSRTLVQDDWAYGFDDDYSDTSSSVERKYSSRLPPLRSERHSRGLPRSIRSDSEGSSIYSAPADDIYPQERKRWWQRILEI